MSCSALGDMRTLELREIEQTVKDQSDFQIFKSHLSKTGFWFKTGPIDGVSAHSYYAVKTSNFKHHYRYHAILKP